MHASSRKKHAREVGGWGRSLCDLIPSFWFLVFDLEKRWVCLLWSPILQKKIRRDKSDFDHPTAQVVRFWPKIGRLDPSDYQIEKWHGSSIKQKSNCAEPAKRSSTCSLPDEQYIRVIYGDMIQDSRMYEYYKRVWYWEMRAWYWMKMLRWCAVRMSITPLETCLLWYVWFWVDSDGTPAISV